MIVGSEISSARPPTGTSLLLSRSDCSAFLLIGIRYWIISLIPVEYFSAFDVYFSKYRMDFSSSRTIFKSKISIQLCKWILQWWFIRGSLILLRKLSLNPPFLILTNWILHVHWKSNGNINQQHNSLYSVPYARCFLRKKIFRCIFTIAKIPNFGNAPGKFWCNYNQHNKDVEHSMN